jgi:3-phenylpropionate/cinnamic acid dioxygenase small subunit
VSAPLDAQAAAQLLYREADCLDRRRWDEWLSLYAEDAVYRIPTWLDEDTPADDPDRCVSLIHYASRAGLEDRIWRIRSGLSVASAVLPRTAHAVLNVRLGEAAPGGEVVVHSVFHVDLFEPRARASQAFFGRYEHRLRRVDDRWLIAGKTIVLMNDVIPTMIDVYSV